MQALGDRTTREVLQTLEDSLANPRLQQVPELAKQRLQASAPQDVTDLSGHLDALVQTMIAEAEAKLAERGGREAKEMRVLLIEQRDRIRWRQQETDQDAKQLTLEFAVAEKRQLDADRRHWEKRLKDLELEIESEPARIEAVYRVKASRAYGLSLGDRACIALGRALKVPILTGDRIWAEAYPDALIQLIC